jgi:hypothetical protein
MGYMYPLVTAVSSGISKMQSSKRATILEWLWWIVTPVVAVLYLIVWGRTLAERMMFAFISAMSSMALAITYGAKVEAAKAKEQNESE